MNTSILIILLMIPFTVLIVALNMKRSNDRYLSKLKEKADRKAKNQIK
jgi:hypothetical protein|tara:strand:- start:264 stop:407 length:144 start_codon:yes stop_codon:yes gene_type:complete